MVAIDKATDADIVGILEVVRLAFAREARRLDNWRIAPLMETAEELARKFPGMTLLVAREDGKIVGTGRCTRSGSDAFVGRLAVHPDHQRKGIASAIVKALETANPDAARFEIFTSEKSADNIALYAKLGYREFKRVTGDQGVMVFMEKRK